MRDRMEQGGVLRDEGAGEGGEGEEKEYELRGGEWWVGRGVAHLGERVDRRRQM